MTIFFDFEVKATDEQKSYVWGGAGGIVLQNIKDLVESRWSVLKDEIEWQDGHIMLCIWTKTHFDIEYYNFTPDLVHKMKSCISLRDWEYISTKISQDLRAGGHLE